MTRNKHFKPEREPLRNTDALQLNNDEVHGPVSFLNPTQARFTPVQTEKTPSSDVLERSREDSPIEEITMSSIEFKWTSRNNRKGRHALVIQPTKSSDAAVKTPPPSSNAKEVLKGILRMFFYFPVWDISYLIAILFTFGSVIWTMNAFFILLPLATVETMSAREVLFTAGITPFVATSTFLLACMLLMLEAYNENREGCFGWALERVYDQQLRRNDFELDPVTCIVPRKDECTHHHQNVLNLVGKPSRRARSNMLKKSVTTTAAFPEPGSNKNWVWFPSWRDLRTHYIHEFAFLACSIQLFGILAYWISSVVALPRINRALRDPSELDAVYWS